jgi:phytoene synthase
MGSQQGSTQGDAVPAAIERATSSRAGSDFARRLGDEDARSCQRVVARHARTFFAASRLLPPRKRRAAYAVYATCRTADDIVDARAGNDSTDDLHRFRDETFQALRRRSDRPMLRELARAWREFDIPDEPLHELFDGLEQDLHDVEYRSWSVLEPYCQGVAGSVGEICCAIFGHAADVRGSHVVKSARTLGVAMQLTNILRDVGEDAKRGRCYLPLDELEEHGLSRPAVIAGPQLSHPQAWRSFMQFQVSRARALYEQALGGIPLLQPDAQRCAVACAAGYEKILDAIEAADFDTWSRRVSASRLTLLSVAWRSWRGEFPPAARAVTPDPRQAEQ